jgi:hypothetical protein
MKLPLTKYEHTAQTIISVPLITLSPLCLLLLVRGRLHSEFVRLLFLQVHRETDRFFAASGVQLAQPTSGLFHFTLATLSSINLVSVLMCSSSPRNPVYVSRVGHSALSFRLSSHRHSYIGLLFGSHFTSS